MSRVYTSAEQLIGKTPLLELTHIEKEYELQAKILAKLEYFNPAGIQKIISFRFVVSAPNISDTCLAFFPTNSPFAILKKYASIQPPTVV